MAENIEKTEKKSIILDNVQDQQDVYNEAMMKNAGFEGNVMQELIKHSMGSANRRRKVPRLAITSDPLQKDNYAGIYKVKRKLLPDFVIKQIRVSNFLVAGILRARGNVW
jgi:hypothetical protein